MNSVATNNKLPSPPDSPTNQKQEIIVNPQGSVSLSKSKVQDQSANLDSAAAAVMKNKIFKKQGSILKSNRGFLID